MVRPIKDSLRELDLHRDSANPRLCVVQNVANYGVLWARCESPMGRNALHCMRRYNAAKFDAFIWKFAMKDI